MSDSVIMLSPLGHHVRSAVQTILIACGQHLRSARRTLPISNQVESLEEQYGTNNERERDEDYAFD